ncbi:MAG: hypothetical protein LBC06_01185 [Rickettsiales bacterium]|nr:hypothetical protein [Rickettsiales bacterium]
MNKINLKEVAELLDCHPETVRVNVKKLFPELVENGKMILLSENEVIAVKKEIQRHNGLSTTYKTTLEGMKSPQEIMEDYKNATEAFMDLILKEKQKVEEENKKLKEDNEILEYEVCRLDDFIDSYYERLKRRKR